MIDRGVEELRAGLESLSVSESAAEPCPTPDAVWAAVDGEADRETRIEILEHTVHCAECAETWRIARGMVEAKDAPRAVEGRVESEARSPAPEPWARSEEIVPFPDRRAALTSPPETRFGGLAVAASLAVAALGLTTVGWWWLEGGASTPSGVEYRQGGGGQVEIATADGAVVSRQGFSLRWHGPEGARYRVAVATETLDEVWRAGGVEANEIRVPSEALANLPSGTLLLWTLEATTLEEGTLSLPTRTLILGDESDIEPEAPGPTPDASSIREETEANNG